MSARGPLRLWLRRTALAALGLVALWLLAVNLLLATPLLSSGLSRHPQRFHIAWRWGWCLLPAHVHLYGLRLGSNATRVGWTLGADRASGEVELAALLRRELRVRRLHAGGVEAELSHRPTGGARDEPAPVREGGARTPPPRGAGHRPWSLHLGAITLDHVREVRSGDLRLVGDGDAAGALRLAFGGEMQLAPTRLRLHHASLIWGGRTLARRLDLDAGASIGPYAPRLHRGLAGWDFLSATLATRGEVEDLPFLAGLLHAPTRSGSLVANLRVDGGRLTTGSRLSLTAEPGPGGDDGRAPGLDLRAAVQQAAGGPRLRLDVTARGLRLGGGGAAPPVLQVADLALAASAAETRVRYLVAAARSGRTAVTAPIVGELRATGVHIDAPSSRLSLHATLDGASGRVDLGALLAREVAVAGLEVTGADVRLELASPAAGARPPRAPWSVRVDEARLDHLRSVRLGELALVGDGSAEATLSLDRGGTLTVAHAAVTMPAGRFEVGGEPAASELALAVAAQVAPVATGTGRASELLHATSGTARVRGKVASLGFLRPYLQRVPWLAVQGQGGFRSDLHLESGRFAVGSQLTVDGNPVVATILASRASGRGTVAVAVEPGPAGARTALRVRFERFGLADVLRSRQPHYLRGRGLQIVAIAPAAVDLSAPLQDFDATLDLPDAEVPDLTIYDRLLPTRAGLSLLGGHGTARLHLEASSRTHRARGSVDLHAEGARIRFQDLEVEGRLALHAPLVSPDLTSGRFDLAGTTVDVDEASYHDLASDGAATPPVWWAHAALDSTTLSWQDPISLRGTGTIAMKDTGPLLALFAQRRGVVGTLVHWFDDALTVENVHASGVFRLDRDLVAVDSLEATGGDTLEVRTRMRFAASQRRGDLYLRYGHLAAGIELRDGQRSYKLRQPREWFDSSAASWP